MKVAVLLLAVSLLAGVALVARYAVPALVDRWVERRLERAERRLSGDDYDGATADAQAVLRWRPRSEHARIVLGEARRCRMYFRLVVMPTCGGMSMPPTSGAPREGGGR